MRKYSVLVIACLIASLAAAFLFLRTPSSVFLRTPLHPENCQNTLEEPPSVVSAFKVDETDNITPALERFLNTYAETCFASNEQACQTLHNWFVRQLQETMFLPEHKTWIDGEWHTKTPGDCDQRLQLDIYGNKLLATMAASYWVLRQKNFPEIPQAEAWFLKRYQIFKPHYQIDEVYSIQDENKVIEIPMRAGNMYSASARNRAFILLAFGNSDGMEVLEEQWKTTLLTSREDGSLPVEARRGARALFYSNQTMFDLMMIHLIAKNAGHDLIEKFPETKPRLEKVALFLLQAVADFKVVEKYARINHSPNTDDNYRVQDMQSLKARMSWLPVYLQEFPNTEVSRLAKSTSVDPIICSVPERKKPFDCAKGSSKLKEILATDKAHISGLKPSCFILKKPIEDLFSTL